MMNPDLSNGTIQLILHNKIQCTKCLDIIESVHRHDFKWCKCGAVAVDGGKDYMRRVGNFEDWVDKSEDVVDL
jgi:hypothetical protein